MKEFNGKILILTSLIALCIVLSFDYYRDHVSRDRISQRVQGLEAEIHQAETRLTSTVLKPPRSASNYPEWVPRDRPLSGPCFFEAHEIEGFLLKRLKDQDESLKIFPPLNLTARPVQGGVELTWSHNPKNDALIKKLQNNPLLILTYKVFRWSSGKDGNPLEIQTLPLSRNRFIDKSIDPVGKFYFYSVLSVFEGTVNQQKTLIESRRSNVRSVECADLFTLRLLGGNPKSVQIEVTIQRDGIPFSHIFIVEEGEAIGGELSLPGYGPVDFSTTLRLTAIIRADEQREETVKHPVFNSDGSRSLDPITRTPLFEDKVEWVTHQVFSVECEDPSGNKRIIEGS